MLYLHIAGGSAALLSMLVPLVTKKGGVTHRRAGWVFVSRHDRRVHHRVPAGRTRWLTDSQTHGARGRGIPVLCRDPDGHSVSGGVRVLRAKTRTGLIATHGTSGYRRSSQPRALRAAATGSARGISLFTAFSFVGLFAGGGHLAYWTDGRHPTRCTGGSSTWQACSAPASPQRRRFRWSMRTTSGSRRSR